MGHDAAGAGLGKFTQARSDDAHAWDPMYSRARQLLLAALQPDEDVSGTPHRFHMSAQDAQRHAAPAAAVSQQVAATMWADTKPG